MDFPDLFSSCFGEDLKAASEYFGVNIRTIYRWLDGTTPPPLMAVNLLSIRARNYLPDEPPYKDWSIKGSRITTPFGTADAYELEQFPAYRARYLRTEQRAKDLENRYSQLLDEVDFLIERLENLKRLRSQILHFS